MLEQLTTFIITAKKATYIVSKSPVSGSRAGAHDLAYDRPPFAYCDSYFGGEDFLGQEVVWHKSTPVWAMNYYGYILRPDLITPAQAGDTLKAALSLPHTQGRLLDDFEFVGGHGHYAIKSQGTIAHFSGIETIHVDRTLAYQLDYHGGLIKP